MHRAGSVTPFFGPLELVLLVVHDSHLLPDLPGANISGTLLEFRVPAPAGISQCYSLSARALVEFSGPCWIFESWSLAAPVLLEFPGPSRSLTYDLHVLSLHGLSYNDNIFVTLRLFYSNKIGGVLSLAILFFNFVCF
jgi:hypothetical protein